MKTQTLTELLNLRCARTGKPIEAGETVKLFDWGTNRVPFGYGSYNWDEQERAFILTMNHTLNDHAGYDSSGIDDRYDLFRTTPEKLNDEEKKLLKQWNDNK